MEDLDEQISRCTKAAAIKTVWIVARTDICTDGTN